MLCRMDMDCICLSLVAVPMIPATRACRLSKGKRKRLNRASSPYACAAGALLLISHDIAMTEETPT